MRDDDLKKILDSPDAPGLDDATRERIVKMALNRYREAGRLSGTTRRKSVSGWLIRALKPAIAVAVCLVLIVTVRNQISAPPNGDTAIVSAQMTDSYTVALFEEYHSLFQQELRALVAHDGEVDVILGGQEKVQINPVVFIHLEKDGEPVFITAYSGQTVETEIGGQNVKMEILMTSDSNVVLASDDFMFEKGVIHGAEGFYADAHVLETEQ